jgi:hypothetical protein
MMMDWREKATVCVHKNVARRGKLTRTGWLCRLGPSTRQQVAKWYKKSKFGQIFDGLGMEQVGIHILGPFGTYYIYFVHLYGHLVI